MNRILPEKSFYLFGMGNRTKLIYSEGRLASYPDYQVLFQFDVKKEKIVPEDYTVVIGTSDGDVRIFENENGVYVVLPSGEEILVTESYVNLPDFKGSKYRDLLRILHHEVLINVIDGKPVPNFFVYKKPWYRDAAMMAMVMKHTDNIHLIADFIKSIDTVYDENNGVKETDNIGQVLYLLSLIGENNHPMVEKCLNEAKMHLVDGTLDGSTDFGLHPVYQTKWLRLGMDALGLNTEKINVPKLSESYASLSWFDGDCDGYGDDFRNKAFDEYYPYLSWARWHFYNEDVPVEALEITYPLTWEAHASAADYNGIRQLSESYADNKLAAPHTWHAAEMFLYLIEK